ncbi:cell division cycle protein 27 homolog B-like [Hibiscus syriacus]|uniref:cell division cycle protein 27 homolog B-like n=1 Tax=Hibiscus syriacus TaxID=106335 RepID=UPI0019225B23|nr:cell division cycle protein 27 homolog B-like [Hibiscus syriacus]
MEALLSNYVEESLNQYMTRNAVFLSERLFAEFPSEVNSQLLARCYLTKNQPHSAYYILKGMEMAQSRYLFAIACLEMDLFSEAEAALMPIEHLCTEVPNGAAMQYLLGIIYRDTARMKRSVEHFRKALSIDPLFWAAYEELCMLGEAEEVAVYFGDAAIPCVQEHYLGNPSDCLLIAGTDHSLGSSQIFGFKDMSLCHLQQKEEEKPRDICQNNHGGPILRGAVGQITNSCCNTPSLSTSPVCTQISDTAPPSPVRNIQLHQSEGSLRPRPQAQKEFVCENESEQIRGSLFFNSGLRRSARLAASVRRLNTSKGSENKEKSFHASTKLNSETCTSTSRQGKLLETSEVAVSELKTTSSSSSSTANVNSIQHEIVNTKLRRFVSDTATINSGISDTLTLLRILGEGYRHLCMFRCKEALNVYQKLSSKQYNTGWVLSQVGKAYFELVDYLNADYAFSLARQISPHSVEEMDVYSTVLYHLKEEMKLKYLAQELLLVDRFAPQTWCAIGNCYSLRKDHETALKSFQRALQLNSRFAYALTLSGHEYVIMEDYKHGAECYEKSLNVDARQYKSWYGLGVIYLHQEKFEFAEHHFRQAYHINPFSSVIMYYLGTTLEALKRSGEALEMVEKAIVTDKKNPLPKYSKAKLLVTLGKLNEALKILEELKESTPHESSIYALMGEIYKQHKKYDKAMLHFGLALDLKPSLVDVAKIKAAIGKLNIPDEIEDSLE